MKSKIHIPEPCGADWNLMTPNQQGRFCSSCDKTVIDFTKMPHPEIQKYFSANSGKERICGHFNLNQVAVGNPNYYGLSLRLNRIRFTPLKKAALFTLSVLFTLTSCMERVVTGEVVEVEDNTRNENEINHTAREDKAAIDSLTDNQKNNKRT